MWPVLIFCHYFLFLSFFVFLLIFSSLFFSLLSVSSCWRLITGTAGLYLLYWALDSQVCIQCWWMFLMSRAQCECGYVCVCGNVCVGCLKWSAWSAESWGRKKIKATGNMLVFAIHRQMRLHNTQIYDRKLAWMWGFCNGKIMTPSNKIQIALLSHFTLIT